MVKYHINPATGVTSLCEAKGSANGGRDCMFIHGDSPESATRNMEKVFEESSLMSLQKADDVTDSQVNEDDATAENLRALAATAILRKPLKELNTSHLIQDITLRAIVLGMDSEKVSSAISLASILHENQTRQVRGKFKIVPYIEHPLRNTSRLMRAGVTDEKIIIASLLHDTVEDGAKTFTKTFYKSKPTSEIEARALLREYIGSAYDDEVLDIVDRVTNDYETPEEAKAKTTEEKHTIYKAHVESGVTGHKGAFLVKVSDFIDNAGSLRLQMAALPQESLPRFQRIAKKYKPMIQVFRKALTTIEIDEGNGPSEEGTRPLSSYVKTRLKQIEQDLDNIITS